LEAERSYTKSRIRRRKKEGGEEKSDPEHVKEWKNSYKKKLGKITIPEP